MILTFGPAGAFPFTAPGGRRRRAPERGMTGSSRAGYAGRTSGPAPSYRED
jgi:hypothetical protein